jgi:outer membrane protein assembly factor BamB
MIGQGMSDNELIELLGNTLPQDLSPAQIETLRKAIRSSPAVREALMEELRLETGLATRLAPDQVGAEEFIDKITNRAAERSRTKWIWLSAIFILVAGIVVGGVGIAWNLSRKPVGPEVVVNKDSGRDGGIKDGDAEDPDKKTKSLVTGTGDKTLDPVKGTAKAGPEPVKPLSELPLPPFSPAWKLWDDAAARGDRRWASRIGQVIRPIGASRLTANEREGDYAMAGRFEVLPPNDDGRAIRLRLSEMRKMRLTFWGQTRGVRIDIGDERMLKGFSVTRGEPTRANLHGLPAGTDDRFFVKNVFERVDPQIDFNWGEGAPAPGVAINEFAVRWQGYIKIAAAGKYRFFASSDDGIMLTVAGRRIAEYWGPRAMNTSVGEIELPEGEHEILVEYYDGNSIAGARLEWEGPNIKRQVVPSTVLRTAKTGDAGRVPGLKARYFWGPGIEPVGQDITRFIADDASRWRLLREGGIDLRYQEGQVVIARGDLVLLTLPMPEKPSEVTLETEARLWLAEELRFRPLALKQAPPAAVESRKAGDLVWAFDPPDREKVVTLSKNEDGSVAFNRTDPNSTLDFRGDTLVDITGGAEVTIEASGMTPGALLVFQSPVDNSTMNAGLGMARGQMVLCYNGQDVNDVDRRYREGWTIPFTPSPALGSAPVSGRFWVKVRYGLDSMTVFSSTDGKNFGGFDYRELDASRACNGQVKVGVYAFWEKGERRATIHSVSVRHYSALDKLADAQVIAAVPVLSDAAAKKAVALDELLDSMAQGRPKDVGEAAWRVACDAVILRSSVTVAIREAAAFDLVRAAIMAHAPSEAIGAALAELPIIVALSREDQRPHSFVQYLRLHDELAMRLWSAGEREKLDPLLDSFHSVADYGWQMRWYQPRQMAPPVLVKLAAFHHWDKGDMAALRRLVMRYEFVARIPHPWIDKSADDYSMRLFCAWMLAQANEQLADIPEETEGDRGGDRQLPRRFAQHPLVVESDRESMNTVAEFLAAVSTSEFDHACRILTRQSLPDGIAPVDKDGRLFKATYVLLREMIDSHEQLASRIRQQYAAIGLIRLRQALDQGRLDALDALATQFHGTEASRQALAHMADRDLSMGNFFSAASRYDSLLEQAMEADRPVIAAKRRLAMAMAGEDAGEPVRHSVQLGNQELSPGDFEALVSSLLEERRKSGFMPDNNRPIDQIAFAPKPVRLTALMDISTARDMPERAGQRIREISYACRDNILLMHQHAKLTAYDLVGRKMLWQKHESARDLSSFAAEPATPLILGDRVFVPFFREKRTELTCFDLHKGDVIWRQVFDDALAGDPIAIGPWLYVLSVRREVGDYGDIVLRRLAPESGESVMAKRVVRVRYGEELFRVGRPQLVGDALVFRTGASLVSCDLLGSARWIRRLSLVPPSVDSPLFDFQAMSDFIIEGDRMIVTSPGSPHVACISARTGEETWSYLQPRLRRLVARRGDSIVIATVSHLEALDLKTGKVLWQSPLTADYDAVLPAGKDMIAAVTLDRIEAIKTEGRRIRKIEWINAATGQVTKAEPLDELGKDVFDIESLFTDGKVIVGVSNINAKGKAAKLVVIEGK